MKLNKFNKKLKDEFNDTIEDKIVVKEAKRFHFKFRYVLLSLAAILIIALVTDHIMVQDYNSKLVTPTSFNYAELNATAEKYTSKNDLSSALIYTPTTPKKKRSTIDNIGAMFNMLSCTSAGPKGTSSAVTDYGTGNTTPIDGGTAPGEGSSGKSSYNTNVQESGIDEADVAKCDGTYIYSMIRSSLFIYDLEGILIVGKNVFESSGYSDTDVYNLYVFDDKIIILSAYQVVIYIFDGVNLTLAKEYKGYYVESRLADNHLYLIMGEKLSLDKVDYNNAYYDGCLNPDYLYRIYKINLNNIEDAKEADLTSSYNACLYMSNNYFYFYTRNYWNVDVTTSIFILDYNLKGYTVIKEEGYAINKYSFSEYDGMFRYVLTDTTKIICNSLYVYDLAKKELKGSLKNQIGLARETVRSVRFAEDKCYVCTYRNTDPLYLIDLSDPANPKIESELHVPGYSGYLHYFNINDKVYVLGVGYNEMRSPKISLYEEVDGELKQAGKSLVLTSNPNLVSFDEEEYYAVDGYTSSALVDSYIGYMLYVEDSTIYLGSPIGNSTYAIFAINVEEETISVYKKHIYGQENENYYYKYLRCFLVEGKLYYVGDGNITIEDF